MATERLIGAPGGLVSALHLFIAGCVLVVYNAPRIARKAYADELLAANWVYSRRFWYFIFFGAGVVIAGGAAFYLSAGEVVWCLLLGVVTFSYSLPLLPFGKRRRIRDYGWLKIAVLSFVWTVVTAVLPIVHWGKLPAAYPVEIAVRLVFIFVLCMLFDMRDVLEDQRNNIHTLPAVVGEQQSYRLVYSAIGVFVVLSVVQYSRFMLFPRLAGALITAIVAGVVVKYLKKHPTHGAYNVLADGLMLVYAVPVVLL